MLRPRIVLLSSSGFRVTSVIVASGVLFAPFQLHVVRVATTLVVSFLSFIFFCMSHVCRRRFGRAVLSIQVSYCRSPLRGVDLLGASRSPLRGVVFVSSLRVASSTVTRHVPGENSCSRSQKPQGCQREYFERTRHTLTTFWCTIAWREV